MLQDRMQSSEYLSAEQKWIVRHPCPLRLQCHFLNESRKLLAKAGNVCRQKENLDHPGWRLPARAQNWMATRTPEPRKPRKQAAETPPQLRGHRTIPAKRLSRLPAFPFFLFRQPPLRRCSSTQEIYVSQCSFTSPEPLKEVMDAHVRII